MAKQGEIIVGLDIGTTKVAAVVGEVVEDGVDIIGMGSNVLTQPQKGDVLNIDSTCAAITKTIEEAEQMAGCDLSTVYVGISGSHIKSFNKNGIVKVFDSEIKQSDVERVLEQTRAVAIHSSSQVIQVIPQRYLINDHIDTRDPIGVAGVRLEAIVHIITAGTAAVQNITKCVGRCERNVAGIVLDQIAASESVLHDDEKELGVALVDIGGQTTNLVIFADGAVVHTSSIPVGGQHVTNDIAAGLRTPKAEAERIKQRFGCSLVRLADPSETIEVPSVGGRPPTHQPRQVLAHIIEPRVEEIISMVHRAILDSGYADLLGSGMVLTGGTTLLEGIAEAAEQVTGLTVRIGVPFGFGGMKDMVESPVFATGAGLVNYGAKFTAQPKTSYQRSFKGGGSTWLDRVKAWIAAAFF